MDLSCWVKHHFFRLESHERLLMFEMSFKGGDELFDSEYEALPDEAAAELAGGPGDWEEEEEEDDDGRYSHFLKLTSS